MATKNNRRTVMTKRILKDSLLELMCEKSISKITIKEICEVADMSRSTFYLHYQDQYDLLKDIEEEIVANTFENLSKLDTEMNSIDSIVVFLNYVKDNQNTFGILLADPENRSFQETVMNSVWNYVKSVRSNEYNDDEEELIYTYIMNGSINVIIKWIQSDFKLPAKTVAKLIYSACDKVMVG